MKISLSLYISLILFCLLSVSGNAVEFVFDPVSRGEDVREVYVAGSFNDWQPEYNPLAREGTIFKGEIDIEDGDYPYKLVVVDRWGSRHWILDPSCAVYVPDLRGNINNLLVVKNNAAAYNLGELERFEWYDKNATQIYLAGDFNLWTPDSVPLRCVRGGLWECWLKIKRPFAYKFRVDGEWATEDKEPGIEQIFDNFGGRNNYRYDLDSPGTLKSPEDTPDRHPITFRFDSEFIKAPIASVSLIGSFNNWDPLANKMTRRGPVFLASISLADGSYAYKFHISEASGHEYSLTDPTHTYYEPDGFQSVNSLMVVEDGKRIVPTDGLEKFTFYAPEAGYVNLAGDFNGWKQGLINLHSTPDGNWTCWLKIPRPITYKFVVDGQWFKDQDLNVLSVWDGYGKGNSFRPLHNILEHKDEVRKEAAQLSEDMEWPYRSTEEALIWARRYAQEGNYIKALAIVWHVQKQCRAEDCSEALLVEAEVHRRYGFELDAFECWKKISESYPNTNAHVQAINELAKISLYINSDPEAARAQYSRILQSSDDPREIAANLYKLGFTHAQEENWKGAIEQITEAIQVAPRPDGNDDQWAGFWTEMYLGLGVCHYNLGEYSKAREAFDFAIHVSPWPDSPNAQQARNWLNRIEQEGLGEKN